MAGGMARMTPPTCKATPPCQSTTHPGLETEGFREYQGLAAIQQELPYLVGSDIDGPDGQRIADLDADKARNRGDPEQGGQGQDGHRMKRNGGGDADKDSQGHPPGKFPGVLLEAEEFQPVVAEQASQIHTIKD